MLSHTNRNRSPRVGAHLETDRHTLKALPGGIVYSSVLLGHRLALRQETGEDLLDRSRQHRPHGP